MQCILRLQGEAVLTCDVLVISIFGFAAVLMQTWEATLAFASYALPNGGRPALIYTYMVAWFGFGAAILSMAEMASMAPTSGGKSTAARSRDRVLTLLSRLVGQYHWVSEFAPRSTQRILSYIVGWFSILAWAAGGIAGQCFSVGLQIEGLIILNSQTYEPQPWHLTLLAIGAVAVCVIFNTLFARKLPAVETVMLVFHTVGGYISHGFAHEDDTDHIPRFLRNLGHALDPCSEGTKQGGLDWPTSQRRMAIHRPCLHGRHYWWA